MLDGGAKQKFHGYLYGVARESGAVVVLWTDIDCPYINCISNKDLSELHHHGEAMQRQAAAGL